MGKSRIQKLVEKHEAYRSQGINLIASENYLSAAVRKALTSDLGTRYHSEWYGGSQYAQKIIHETEELAQKLFNAKHAIVTPVSGNICDLSLLFALTKPNGRIAMVPFTIGGYPLGIGKFDRKRFDIPVDTKSFAIDIAATKKMLTNKRINLVILGTSFFLFPHPVRELSSFAKKAKHQCHCVYDGSHVMGLIACGAFQNPLKEGAEVVFGSTHKTLFGPQGGIVLTNSRKHAKVLRSFLELDLDEGIGLIDNPHMNRIAALGLAMEEMLGDKGYGKRVIKNAQILAKSLDSFGVPVKFKERGYTRSHQVLMDLDENVAKGFCRTLEKVGIFIDIAGRLGTAEVTHRGMAPKDMVMIARFISRVYEGVAIDKVKRMVRSLAKKHSDKPFLCS
jgi:glycine hydroxymethyltransferase